MPHATVPEAFQGWIRIDWFNEKRAIAYIIDPTMNTHFWVVLTLIAL
jgi:hypothetical protein